MNPAVVLIVLAVVWLAVAAAYQRTRCREYLLWAGYGHTCGRPRCHAGSHADGDTIWANQAGGLVVYSPLGIGRRD